MSRSNGRNRSRDSDLDWSSKIDADVLDLTERTAGMESSMSAMHSAIQRLTKSVEHAFELQHASSKTQWPVLLSAFALVMVIVGGFLNGYVRDLTRVEDSVDYLTRNNVSMADPVQNAVIARLNQDIVDQYTVIEREMRLLDDNANEKIAGLNSRLSKSERWEDEHDKRVVGLNSTQTQRIVALERKVFGTMGRNK